MATWAETVIVTRTKDRPLLLRRAMEHIIAQTHGDWHHVIVNDGGDRDHVAALVEAMPGYEGRVSLVHNCPNMGMEAASNAGLLMTDSAYFAIHDDDDSWAPDFLARTVEVMRRHEASPRFGGVVAGVTVVHEEIEVDEVREVRREPFRPDMEFVGLTSLLPENQFPPIAMLCRRSVLDLLGLFDSRKPVLGDWDFHLRVARHFELAYLREPLANYHHRGSASGSLSNSVYADSWRHRAIRAGFLDGMLRDRLAEAPGTMIDFLLAAEREQRIMRRLGGMQAHNDWVSGRLAEIEKAVIDAEWRQKNHFEWRHEQLRWSVDQLLGEVQALRAELAAMQSTAEPR
ncbi:glycosyltransferase family 2 protein [Neoroseomonas rubea]|uniref:glycosyltransferase family 2 protein n=1 Tax=Neoroseomonas rubea TaxID=2748666 RepID=UPI0018DF5C19